MNREGDDCRFNDCNGALTFGPVEGCSCHINPPCGACVDNPLVCDHCGDEPVEEFPADG